MRYVLMLMILFALAPVTQSSAQTVTITNPFIGKVLFPEGSFPQYVNSAGQVINGWPSRSQSLLTAPLLTARMGAYQAPIATQPFTSYNVAAPIQPLVVPLDYRNAYLRSQ